MAMDIYEKLAQHLDNLPAGYPRTEGGVELRILRRLFSPEEAELAQHLTLIAEPARVIARRAKISIAEASQRLEEMESKGLIYVYHQEGREPEYMATHWAIGIYEFQVNRLDPEFVEDIEEYSATFFDQMAWDKAPQLRTIPVGESINAQIEVMPYERAETLIRAQDQLAVAPCICRKKYQIAGKACDKPLETCLLMGSAASYYLRNDLGRMIDQDEALNILALAEAEALVLQPGNSKEAINICVCCGCCCGVLTNIKRHPRPASMVASAFVVTHEVETCDGCGTCESRCQMEAIYLDNGWASLNLDRCIGCGLCVSTCPTDSLKLVRKPEVDQPYVPQDLTDTNIKLGQARGKLTTGELMSMMVRSKVDRLLSPK